MRIIKTIMTMLMLTGLLTGCHDDDDLAKIKDQQNLIGKCNDQLNDADARINQIVDNRVANEDQAIINGCGYSFGIFNNLIPKIIPGCDPASVAKATKDAKADPFSDVSKAVLKDTYWKIIGYRWFFFIVTIAIIAITFSVIFYFFMAFKNTKRREAESGDISTLENTVSQKTEENNVLKQRVAHLTNTVNQLQQNEEDDTPDERDERITELETHVEKLKNQLDIAHTALEMKKLF
ncbi:hypothetical protein [Sulfuriferula nivalis]|uniref:Lipoprotein n=1 Tax=Sulfuriferula nivalis TaxID=2675298 RepID=A0A809RM93_9PROT|nr:hypothetical protein [Sulfuriferula nivalis]BBP02525.1 hypothetical protein SFSGTM_32330 [Sulfuriferula nivalis]